MCFGCFSVCFVKPKNIVFGLFRFFRPVRNNRNKQNFVETNRKILQKTFSIRGSSKPLLFFSVWTKPNRNSICFGCFLVCFSRNQQIFFRFVSMLWTSIETTETNRTYGVGNKKGWYFNKFAAVSVGLLFFSVVSKHQNSLFQYLSETNVLVRIVPKLVSVLVSVVSIWN
jgi:hypothetical protein